MFTVQANTKLYRNTSNALQYSKQTKPNCHSRIHHLHFLHLGILKNIIIFVQQLKYAISNKIYESYRCYSCQARCGLFRDLGVTAH
jgi:hypothetical protein